MRLGHRLPASLPCDTNRRPRAVIVLVFLFRLASGCSLTETDTAGWFATRELVGVSQSLDCRVRSAYLGTTSPGADSSTTVGRAGKASRTTSAMRHPVISMEQARCSLLYENEKGKGKKEGKKEKEHPQAVSPHIYATSIESSLYRTSGPKQNAHGRRVLDDIWMPGRTFPTF